MSARKTTPKTRSQRRRKTVGGAGRWWAALAVALAVAIAGVGVLNWARTDVGRARLLGLGAERYRAPVQDAIDTAVARVLPGYLPGPAAADSAGADPNRYDWSLSRDGSVPDAPETIDGISVRCRTVAAPEGESLWEVHAAVAEAVSAVGGEILWGERLNRPTRRWSAPAATRYEDELLRLDLGAGGMATHTLLIHPAGTAPPRLSWGGEAAAERASDLLGDLDTPTVAVIIDDWGNAQNEITRGLLKLDVPLTLSILPGLPHSRHYALKATELALPVAGGGYAGSGLARDRLARGCPVDIGLARQGRSSPPRKRREVMLHLPMEPQGYPKINPGDAFVSVGMSRREIAALVDASLGSLPGVTGVNNHMGSAATADRSTMEDVMKVLGERDLFFLDSMTTSRSVAAETARQAGLPTLVSRIFLDQRDRDREQVRGLLARLVRSARATGMAIGICHPYAETLAVLAEELPRYRRDGIRFVTASELLALQDERAGMSGRKP